MGLEPIARHREYVQHKAAYAAQAKAYYAGHRVKIDVWYRKYHRLRTYNLSEERFTEMFVSQRGVCAICEKPPKRNFHIDHDHECCEGTKSCGQCIRGLLCERCNPGLGNFKDNPDLLDKAAAYLRKWRERQ